MPYRIANLAYGLRSRLSDLTTKRERYNLQRAAGGACICPPKLQRMHRGDEQYYFSYSNSELCVRELVEATDETEYLDFDEDSRLHYASYVSFTKMDLQSVSSDVFDNFYFDHETTLNLRQCTLSKQFFEKIFAIFGITVRSIRITDTEINLWSTAVHPVHNSYNLNFTDVLTAFPNVKNINVDIKNISPSWMSEILQFQQNNLTSMFVVVPEEQTQLLTVDGIIEFLKAQKKAFSLEIRCNAFRPSNYELFMNGHGSSTQGKMQRD